MYSLTLSENAEKSSQHQKLDTERLATACKQKEGDTTNETFRMGNDYTEPEQEDPAYKIDKARTFNQWPEALPEFREALYKYCKSPLKHEH
jgi:isopenicillin N synthase-like dioxygenase